MSGLEIALLIVGILFFAGSFFFTEKLSSSDIETIERMSEKEVNVIVDKQLKNAENRIGDSIEGKLADSLNRFEKEANKKMTEEIYAISEHADSVRATLDAAVNTEQKSREEVMFLYNMLSDKQEAVTELERQAGQLESALRAMKQSVEDAIERLQTEQNISVSVPKAEEKAPKNHAPADEDPEIAALLLSMTKVMDSANETIAKEENKSSVIRASEVNSAQPIKIPPAASVVQVQPNAAQPIASATPDISQARQVVNTQSDNDALSGQPSEVTASDTARQAREIFDSFEEEISRAIDNELAAVGEEDGNINERIIALHRQGFSDVDIAKRLGKGLGEIKLVLGLYDDE